MSEKRLSKFGVFCRKLRIDRGLLLFDMASHLGVSSAFLSKIENGGGKPPSEWRDKMIELYDLNEYEIDQLDIGIYEAANRKKINIDTFSENDKELMLSFARKLNTFDDEKINKLRQLLNE